MMAQRFSALLKNSHSQTDAIPMNLNYGKQKISTIRISILKLQKAKEIHISKTT
jgi:hypothetical protein